jgi:hypothetical protein
MSVTGVRNLSGGEAVLDGVVCHGWWLIVDEEGPARIVAGPFPDRGAARWAASRNDAGVPIRPVYGIRRPDGSLNRRPSPQDWAWLAHLGEQLERLPDDWENQLAEHDRLVTLMVEIGAALAETGLPLHIASGPGSEVGGASLAPEPQLDGVVVTWRQHDRMSIDQVHGAAADAMVQQVMNRTLGHVLTLRGFVVEPFGGASGHVVRSAA